MRERYFLSPGTRQTDFTDCFALVCGISVLRFPHNRNLAKSLADFLDRPRTIEEISVGVPAIKNPGSLLEALVKTGVVTSTNEPRLRKLKELPSEPEIAVDAPPRLSEIIGTVTGSFPETKFSYVTSANTPEYPVIVVRESVPDMIDVCKSYVESCTLHVPVLPYDGQRLIMGPSVIPGNTACFECMLVRRAALTDWPDEYLRFQKTDRQGEFLPQDLALAMNLAVRLATGAFYHSLPQ